MCEACKHINCYYRFKVLFDKISEPFAGFLSVFIFHRKPLFVDYTDVLVCITHKYFMWPNAFF